MNSDIRLYQPSNGSEGEAFMARWCAHCRHEQPRREDIDADGCDILTWTMALPVDHPNYPLEWRQDGPSGPRCTAFEGLGPDAPAPLDPAAVVRPLL